MHRGLDLALCARRGPQPPLIDAPGEVLRRRVEEPDLERIARVRRPRGPAEGERIHQVTVHVELQRRAVAHQRDVLPPVEACIGLGGPCLVRSLSGVVHEHLEEGVLDRHGVVTVVCHERATDTRTARDRRWADPRLDRVGGAGNKSRSLFHLEVLGRAVQHRGSVDSWRRGPRGRRIAQHHDTRAAVTTEGLAAGVVVAAAATAAARIVQPVDSGNRGDASPAATAGAAGSCRAAVVASTTAAAGEIRRRT